jgi:hypothetical protein
MRLRRSHIARSRAWLPHPPQSGQFFIVRRHAERLPPNPRSLTSSARSNT